MSQQITSFPVTKACPASGDTFYCSTGGKEFKLIIPSGMFSSTVYLRFYEPDDPTINPPPGYSNRRSKVFEIQKLSGPSPNRGYKFKFECYFTQGNVDCAASVDDQDPGSWMPADSRATQWDDNPNTPTMQGGRWDLFGFFANWD